MAAFADVFDLRSCPPATAPRAFLVTSCLSARTLRRLVRPAPA